MRTAGFLFSLDFPIELGGNCSHEMHFDTAMASKLKFLKEKINFFLQVGHVNQFKTRNGMVLCYMLLYVCTADYKMSIITSVVERQQNKCWLPPAYEVGRGDVDYIYSTDHHSKHTHHSGRWKKGRVWRDFFLFTGWNAKVYHTHSLKISPC